MAGILTMSEDDRLLKQVLFGKTDDKIREEDPKEDGQTTCWIGARKILAPCTGSGQNQVEPACETCHGHQRAVSPSRARKITYNCCLKWLIKLAKL